MRDSKLAHKYLDGLKGIEIGGSAHNAFNIPDCLNVDITDSLDTIYKKYEIECCGRAMPVDIIAPGDKLPFPHQSLDYVLSSHVLEHFYDPIQTLGEWVRVIKPGGYIFAIIPHKERTFDKDRELTSISELIERNCNPQPHKDDDHFSVWVLKNFLELCAYLNLDVVEALDTDDKVGNGFCVVIKC